MGATTLEVRGGSRAGKRRTLYTVSSMPYCATTASRYLVCAKYDLVSAFRYASMSEINAPLNVLRVSPSISLKEISTLAFEEQNVESI